MTTKTDMDFLLADLNRMIARRTAAMAKLAENIVKYGIGDRLGWLREPIDDDAKGLIAEKVIAMLVDKSVGEVAQYLEERATQETGYLIMSNSDVAANVAKIQAMQSIASTMRSALRKNDGTIA